MKYTCEQRRAARWWIIIVCVALLMLLAAPLLQYSTERIWIAFRPSAQTAYEYGERHFDARTHSQAYNVAAAKYFFTKSAELGGIDPLLEYQLARIDFLEGNFGTALTHINTYIRKPNPAPNAFYMRGLILGFMGQYDAAMEDYQKYVTFDPSNWAALNDYAWVALKAGKSADALEKIERGLQYFPQNAWLLNSKATALYELHRYPEALDAAKAASGAVQRVTKSDWLLSYPGNDPKIAEQGIATLRNSIDSNMHTIEAAIVSSTVQSR